MKLKQSLKDAVESVKGFFERKRAKKEIEEEFKNLVVEKKKEETEKYPEEAVEAYRETGGIPIRSGSYTNTFKKWYDDNY